MKIIDFAVMTGMYHRTTYIVLLSVLVLNMRCLTLGGIAAGGALPKKARSKAVGGGIGLAGDVAVAAKAGGVAGGVYGLLAVGVSYFVYGLLYPDYPRYGIEFPVYPKTAEGVRLRKFVDGNTKVLVIVEDLPPSQAFASETGPIVNDVIEQMRGEFFFSVVHDAVPLDARSHAGLAGILADRIAIKSKSGVELLLHIKPLEITSSCALEGKVDGKACGGAMVARRAGSKEVFIECQEIPTGKRIVQISWEATLIRASSGQMIPGGVRSEEAATFSPVGDQTCPSVSGALTKAISRAVNTTRYTLSPYKTGMIDLIFYRTDADPAVEKLLRSGYDELDEPPDIERAGDFFRQAVELSRGKSIGALANLGNYYVATGQFEKAIECYERAMNLPSAHKGSWKWIIDRVLAILAGQTP